MNNDDNKVIDPYEVSKLKRDFSDINNINWPSKHSLGIAENIDPEIKKKLQLCFKAECIETGTYLTMARIAHGEGYPEIAATLRQVAYEEADHASRFLELFKGHVSSSTEENLEGLVKAEAAASLTRYEIATACKKKITELEAQDPNRKDGENNEWSVYDFVHDSVHEISRDEARHGEGFLGLLNHYFRGHGNNANVPNNSKLNQEVSKINSEIKKIVSSVDMCQAHYDELIQKINIYFNVPNGNDPNGAKHSGCNSGNCKCGK